MLASIFLGATVLGPLGIVILPFTMIVIKNLNDTGRIHLFRYEKSADDTADSQPQTAEADGADSAQKP